MTVPFAFREMAPRTVLASPVVIRAIIARRPLVGVDMDTLKSIKFKGGRADSWIIVPDPDCPIDYFWPQDAPGEVAALIRQGIEDARRGKP